MIYHKLSKNCKGIKIITILLIPFLLFTELAYPISLEKDNKALRPHMSFSDNGERERLELAQIERQEKTGESWSKVAGDFFEVVDPFDNYSSEKLDSVLRKAVKEIWGKTGEEMLQVLDNSNVKIRWNYRIEGTGKFSDSGVADPDYSGYPAILLNPRGPKTLGEVLLIFRHEWTHWAKGDSEVEAYLTNIKGIEEEGIIVSSDYKKMTYSFFNSFLQVEQFGISSFDYAKKKEYFIDGTKVNLAEWRYVIDKKGKGDYNSIYNPENKGIAKRNNEGKFYLIKDNKLGGIDLRTRSILPVNL